METILSRIQEMASAEGITIGALERRIGASKGVLSRAINNGTDIQSKWVQIIVENYPQYSPRWLMTGKGEMIEPVSKSVPQAGSAPVPEPLPAPDHAAPSPGIEDRLLSLIREKDDRIAAMAEEIGVLKQTVRQLEREKEEHASIARDSRHANAG